MNDPIERQNAIDAIVDCTVYGDADELKEAVMQENAWNKWSGGVLEALEAVEELPSAQPAPISEAYAKAVFTWLLDYQIKAAELKGRYTPYEVLSWVANDWRKEHEGSD